MKPIYIRIAVILLLAAVTVTEFPNSLPFLLLFGAGIGIGLLAKRDQDFDNAQIRKLLPIVGGLLLAAYVKINSPWLFGLAMVALALATAPSDFITRVRSVFKSPSNHTENHESSIEKKD